MSKPKNKINPEATRLDLLGDDDMTDAAMRESTVRCRDEKRPLQ